MTIGGVGAIHRGVGNGVCESFGSASLLGSGRVSVGPICVMMQVAGLQQGLIPVEPIGSEGSQQPDERSDSASGKGVEAHPPQPPEQPAGDSVEQQAVAFDDEWLVARQPVYDQPRKGWSVMARMRARVRRSMGASVWLYARNAGGVREIPRDVPGCTGIMGEWL